MDDVKKMFRTIVNGQSTMKQEMLGEIGKVRNEVEEVGVKVDKVDKKIDGVESRLTKRIDKLGLQIAHLEDDAPTIGEFDKLEKRVSKLEKPAVKN